MVNICKLTSYKKLHNVITRADPEGGSPGGQVPPFAANFLNILGIFLRKCVKFAEFRGKLSKLFQDGPLFKFYLPFVSLLLFKKPFVIKHIPRY